MNKTQLPGRPIKSILISRLVISLILLFTIITGAGCGGTSVPSPRIDTFITIPLGHVRNVLDISKPLFLGHRVSSFRLRVRINNPNGTSQWINGVTLSFTSGSYSEEITELPAPRVNGAFWTQMINGNKVWINIVSDGVVDFQGGSPSFEIIEIERFFESGSAREDIPEANISNEDVLVVGGNSEAIGFSPRAAEAQHYIFHALVPLPYWASVYVSPFSPDIWNDVGLFVNVSFDGLKSYDHTVWIQPEYGDSGVYHEFLVPPNTQYVYVTVKTLLATPYFVNYRPMRQIYSNIIMERDANIGTPTGSDLEAIKSRAGRFRPYNKQLSDYLRANPDINQRINELMVIASANLLNATDGYFRYGSAVLNSQIDWWRDVDVQFSAGSGRANATWSRINLFEDEELQYPVTGAGHFVHEWGHWDFGMPNEYIDTTTPEGELSSMVIDENSKMGGWKRLEYCTELNHYYSEDQGGTDESMWQLVDDQYTVSTPDSGGGHRVATYMDVLHKLDDLFDLTIY